MSYFALILSLLFVIGLLAYFVTPGAMVGALFVGVGHVLNRKL